MARIARGRGGSVTESVGCQPLLNLVTGSFARSLCRCRSPRSWTLGVDDDDDDDDADDEVAGKIKDLKLRVLAPEDEMPEDAPARGNDRRI